MSTPPNSSTANAEAMAALAALQAVADAQFIDQMSQAVANAISQGLYQAILTTFENCNIVNLQTYFIGLGYAVSFPDALNPNVSPFNPAELFGQDLNDFWSNGMHFPTLTNPVRMMLTWRIP